LARVWQRPRALSLEKSGTDLESSTLTTTFKSVTVATTYLHGRSYFETFHVRLLTGRFKDSTITLLKTTTRFLQAGMAVVYWSWKIEGDTNPDGTPASASLWDDDFGRGKTEWELVGLRRSEHERHF
jgi:hypothetical protein